MNVTIGYTHTDRYGDTVIPGGYIPSHVGYRTGAHQTRVTIVLPDRLATTNRAEVAEILWTITNAPADVLAAYDPDVPTGAVLAAILAAGVILPRAIDIGDTITIDGVTLACDKVGWIGVTA